MSHLNIAEMRMSHLNIAEMKVLIVEDNVHFRTLLRSILETLGVTEIREARDGAEAIEVLQEFPCDLALLDWKMDGVDGIECVRRIRQTEKDGNRFLPIIMLTGYAKPDLIKKARDVGVNDFMSKPISPATLISRIIAVLENPKEFVSSEDYFGPDRRNRQETYGGGDQRGEQSGLVDNPAKVSASG